MVGRGVIYRYITFAGSVGSHNRRMKEILSKLSSSSLFLCCVFLYGLLLKASLAFLCSLFYLIAPLFYFLEPQIYRKLFISREKHSENSLSYFFAIHFDGLSMLSVLLVRFEVAEYTYLSANTSTSLRLLASRINIFLWRKFQSDV